MSARVPFAPPFSHLVYLRVFEGCNLHCEHCFIPKNPKRMTHDGISAAAETIAGFAKPGDNVLVQWHGGEPTLFGSAWLEKSMDILEKAAPQIAWQHGIQTNLMTFDEGWADLFRRRFGGNVGVSWDPGIRLLPGGRPETNSAYEEKFWANMGRLLSDGLQPYLVMTATKVFFERFRNPVRLFEFLTSKGIRKAHIERLTETGYARTNWSRIGVDNASYSRGMSRILRAYELWRSVEDNGKRLALSPFDGLVASVERLASGGGGYGCWSGHCDTRFHTIDANGYKAGCTALTSEVDNNRAGGESLYFEKSYAETRAERKIINCTGCPFRTVCSTGCLALSMDDGSGECSGGRKLFETALSLLDRQQGKGLVQ